MGNGDVHSTVLRNLKTGGVMEHDTQGVFIFIGFHPVNELMQGVLDLDAAGHVLTNLQMETNVLGVFAAGDVRQFSDRHLPNAVAAALAAYRYIEG